MAMINIQKRMHFWPAVELFYYEILILQNFYLQCDLKFSDPIKKFDIGEEKFFKFFVSAVCVYIISRKTKPMLPMFQYFLISCLASRCCSKRSLKPKSRTQFNFEHPEGSFITFITQVL